MMALKEYLQQQYQGRESFLTNVVFPMFGEDLFEDGFDESILILKPELAPLAQSSGIESILRIGTINVDFNPIDIYDITVSDKVQMQRNRVSIQMLVRRIMDTYSSSFMIFHYKDNSSWDWRFTFCSKKGNNEDSTDSKRYTFLLGPNQSCRTAAENFEKLIQIEDKESITVDCIISAFDVEALSKEFFGKYKEHYSKFVAYMCDESNGMRDDFIDNSFDKAGLDASKIKDKEEKPIRDYVKRLLGRIVFLHFLQKKGWMGVPAGKNWGDGDKDFMMSLYEYASESQRANFLDEILEPLFSEALNTDRTSDGDLFDTKVNLRNGSKVRVPYLNGGLFERDKYDEPKTVFPAEYFKELLEFFYQYNFTIDENDPNDAQVGVDPEMLGRIFENLLEDNKDKGAFYTPKEIVQYMCRQALVAYLQTNEDDSVKSQIENFVTTYDVNEIGGADSDLALTLDQRLKEVKICDPAIGSGAFPMGLLKELFLCRGAIENFDNASDIKKHIIQNNIYGVDIEKGAVDIARLRFWLSLIVDEDTPSALPNLDYKIMQGNSLLESYKGVDLSQLTAEKKEISEGHQLTFFEDESDLQRLNLRKLLDDYYNCPDHNGKTELKKKISDCIQKQLDNSALSHQGKFGRNLIDLSKIDVAGNDQFFLWHTWFSDVFNRPILRGRDIKRYSYDWANLWLIWVPWHFPLHNDTSIQGASERAEKAFQTHYPALYNHLLAYKKELSARNKAETGIRYEWYALQRWGANYWEEFMKPKIIYREIGFEMDACIAPANWFVNNKLYLVTGDDIEYLLAFLNSKAFNKIILASANLTGGKGVDFMEKVKVPREQNLMKAVQTTRDERQIDALFNDFFGLTEAEKHFLSRD